MRYVIYGAGAVGGVVGAGLHRGGDEVVFIARGAHLDALRARGLRLDTPDGAEHLDIPAVGSPHEIKWRADDVVLLATKSQDTADVVGELAQSAPDDIGVACLQNGVDNERTVARWFANTYGIVVMAPTAHLVPGVVAAYSAPVFGVLDIGRYPRGFDDRATETAAALQRANFSAVATDDVMAWKYRKLLMNLGNVVEALCTRGEDGSEYASALRVEGTRCLDAAGVAYVSEDEDAARRSGVLTLRPINGREREGGSSWQSLARSAGSLETPWLNGEIVTLGVQLGIPTPANRAACIFAARATAQRWAPNTVPPGEMLALTARLR